MSVACDALYVMPRSLQRLKYSQKIQHRLIGQSVLFYMPCFSLSFCDSFSICSDIFSATKRSGKLLLQNSALTSELAFNTTVLIINDFLLCQYHVESY